MSDFDKEAEREKLREKYERDKADRQATQRMSDLLLKGATMTNTHCGTCGDPLFQQDGTTFCPSCHGNPDAVQGTNLEAQPAEEATPEPASSADADKRNDSTAEATADADASELGDTPSESPTVASEPVRPADDADADAGAAQDGTDRPSRVDRSTESSQSVQTPPSQVTSSHATDDNRAQRDEHHMPSSRSPPSTASQHTDLETARASLVDALEKFSRNAAETDDPRYAKECLQAAREASEALDVLR